MINYLQGFCGPGNFLWLLRSCVLRGFGPRAQGEAVWVASFSNHSAKSAFICLFSIHLFLSILPSFTLLCLSVLFFFFSSQGQYHHTNTFKLNKFIQLQNRQVFIFLFFKIQFEDWALPFFRFNLPTIRWQCKLIQFHKIKLNNHRWHNISTKYGKDLQPNNLCPIFNVRCNLNLDFFTPLSVLHVICFTC